MQDHELKSQHHKKKKKKGNEVFLEFAHMLIAKGPRPKCPHPTPAHLRFFGWKLVGF
jgi:hypothetical protein